MLKAQPRREKDESICAEGYYVTNVFLVDQYVNRKNEQRKQEIIRQLNAEKCFHINAHLEGVIAHDQLIDEAGQHQKSHPDQDEQRESPELTRE